MDYRKDETHAHYTRKFLNCPEGQKSENKMIQPVFRPLIPEAVTIIDLKKQLIDSYIDKFSLSILLQMISNICYEKAGVKNPEKIDHLKWMGAAKALENIADKIEI